MRTLTADLAQRFANSTLGHVGREYPNGLSLYLEGPATVSPSGLHPIFFGSFDWHSCVHGWWQLFRIARLFPEHSPDIFARAEVRFTSRSLQGELKYFRENPGFERPYGWGWLLALHREMSRQEAIDPAILEPLAKHISGLFKSYLPRLTYPVRAGTHANTAFALIHAFEWANHFDPELAKVITDWGKSRFGNDVAAPWIEPSGEDFLSQTLTEAVLMFRILEKAEFEAWFNQFLPELPQSLLEPVTVSDRSDGRIGHLDGLNLSRAWCWRSLANRNQRTEVAAEQCLEAALPHLEANYMSEHWLCSFALLAMTDR